MKIYRTVYTVEVFSQGVPFEAAHGEDNVPDLTSIALAIDEGPCIGYVERTHVMEVPPEAVKGELLRIGNDGTFFDDDEDAAYERRVREIMESNGDQPGFDRYSAMAAIASEDLENDAPEEK